VFCDPRRLWFNGKREHFRDGKKRPGHETIPSPACSSGISNEPRYTQSAVCLHVLHKESFTSALLHRLNYLLCGRFKSGIFRITLPTSDSLGSCHVTKDIIFFNSCNSVSSRIRLLYRFQNKFIYDRMIQEMISGGWRVFLEEVPRSRQRKRDIVVGAWNVRSLCRGSDGETWGKETIWETQTQMGG